MTIGATNLEHSANRSGSDWHDTVGTSLHVQQKQEWRAHESGSTDLGGVCVEWI